MNARLRDFVPLVAGLAVALLTLQLGNWQVRRAEEKTVLQALLTERAGHAETAHADAPPPAEWQRVRLAGRWQPEAGLYLDNRTHGGRAGYQVVMPLRLADGSGTVLVNRGWVAAGGDRAQLPAVSTAAGEVTVEGLVRFPEAAPFSLSATVAEGRLWQYLDVAAYRRSAGVAVADWTVQQTSDAADGLVREWPQPDAGVARHRGYALQWYAFAALAAGLTGWYAWTMRQRRKDGDGALE